jgi:hypothetical protein
MCRGFRKTRRLSLRMLGVIEARRCEAGIHDAAFVVGQRPNL